MNRAPFLFPSGSVLGAHNLVLQARATHHRVENYAGPFSIKTMLSGRVAWLIQGRELVVEPGSFLVVPAGEKYSMNIDSEKPVESCCAFFAQGFVERMALDLTSPLERSFDGDELPIPALPYLSAYFGDRENSVIGRVHKLAQRCRRSLTPSVVEEEFIDLGAELLHLYSDISDQVGRLPAARSSTRQELFRRLLIGREYLHSQSGPVALSSVARAAGVSLFHFHRGFTQAFQQTPHSYLTNLRLSKARDLLEGGTSVLEACLEVGFSSPSAFSRLFRSHFGEPPSVVRRKIARSGKHPS